MLSITAGKYQYVLYNGPEMGIPVLYEALGYMFFYKHPAFNFQSFICYRKDLENLEMYFKVKDIL